MTEKRFEFREINELPILPKCYDTEKQEYANLFECVGWLNELYRENEQLKSDKEHLMGWLIRFFGYDDEDIDYNLNRESNREYGKQYYSMKEEGR